MTRKNKIKTIFKTPEELRKFMLATFTFCASLGTYIDQDNISEEQKNKVVDEVMKATFTRMQIVMSEYHKMRMNGDIDDVMAEIPTSEYDEMHDDCLGWIDKVMGEDYDWNRKDTKK